MQAGTQNNNLVSDPSNVCIFSSLSKPCFLGSECYPVLCRFMNRTCMLACIHAQKRRIREGGREEGRKKKKGTEKRNKTERNEVA